MLIDLTPFCGTGELRPYIKQPFSFGEFTYATNGHIIVRVGRRQDTPDGEVITESGILRAIRVADDACRFTLLPVYVFPPADPDADCEKCDWRGVMHDCPDCDCVCGDCDGSGKREKKASLSFSGVAYDIRYLRQIASLPSIEVEASPSGDAPLRFRFEGGIGALMPIRGVFDNHLGNIEDGRPQ